MKSEKKILFIVNSLKLSGAGKMVHYISGLCAEYYNTVYAASLSSSEMVKKDNGVIYTYVPQKNSGGYLARLKTIRNIRLFIKELEPDVCIAFVSDVAFSARVATLFNNKVICVSAERGDPYTLPWIWKKLVSWAYKHSDYCFFQLDKARDFFGKRVRSKSFVIPNLFTPNATAVPYTGVRHKTIVSAGRFAYQKGYDILIKAFKDIHFRHPEYTMTIYGDGPLKDEYNALVADLGLQDVVSFPGYVKDVASAVREEGIFVLPSRYEGIPNVLIEVLAMGVPTVSADCTPGGPAFLTNNGERGLLFPVGDIQKLTDAIERLITDEDLCKTFSQKGPEVSCLLEENRIKSMWVSAIRQITDSCED